MSKIPENKLRDNSQLLRVIPLGDELPYDFKRPHRHNYFEFFLFTEGGGTHYIDFTGYEIAPHSVHIIFPSQIHLLKRSGARGHILVCPKETVHTLPKVFYAQLFSHRFAAPCLLFDDAGFERLMASLTELQEELHGKDALSQTLVQHHLAAVLAQCIRHGEQLPPPAVNHQPRHLDAYRHFAALLEAQFDARHSVAEYATQLCMTPKSLNQSIQAVTGKTCQELLHDRILTEAQRLLLYSDERSKEIAYALGFKDASYFNRFFKRGTGLTPGDFRTFWAQKYQS